MTTDMTRDDRHQVEDETHRAECAACTALWNDLERISAEAARLPLRSPSRDLWADIEARIDALESGTARPMPSAGRDRAARRWVSRPAVRLALAASLLVAVTAGVTWTLATGDDAARTVASDDRGDTGDVPGAPILRQASFRAAVDDFDEEIRVLQTIVDERRAQLDPVTIAVLEANLALIDRAIDESRRALEADPGSRFLAAQFARAYTSKLTLLRDATTLPTGI